MLSKRIGSWHSSWPLPSCHRRFSGPKPNRRQNAGMETAVTSPTSDGVGLRGIPQARFPRDRT